MSVVALSALATTATLAAFLGLATRISRAARDLNAAVARIVDHDLADAFIFLDGRQLLRATAAMAIALVAACYLLDVGAGSTVLLGIAVVLAPRVLLNKLRARRQARLVSQLPDAIQALSALLRAGHSLSQAAGTIADTQPKPLQNEWRLLLRRLRMGERIDSAFEAFADRVGAPEARLFATTVRIALELGGSLAEALENLAGATRRRLEMQSRISALTSQGRLQGLIVGALPLLLLLTLSGMDHASMQLLWTRPAGWAALGVLLCLEACGFVMIRRIVRIDV